jgi:hypothetical protein
MLGRGTSALLGGATIRLRAPAAAPDEVVIAEVSVARS